MNDKDTKCDSSVSVAGMSDIPFRQEDCAAPEMPDEALSRETCVCQDCGCTMMFKHKCLTYWCARCNKSIDSKDVDQSKE